jgi:hypothetical protein
MTSRWGTLRAVLGIIALVVNTGVAADEIAVSLPAGVKAVWDLDRASRDATETSERVCINGLWRWQPAAAGDEAPPARDWGYFKVPGCWPGITDYMQKDSQTLFVHTAWKNTRPASVGAAWYERDVTVPASWTGRRIAVSVEYLNSYAAVFVDGKPAGEIRFPGGELDLTPFCRPGSTHRLSMRVDALPLKAVMLSYTDTATAREVKGTVQRRGLCGDVTLVGTPSGARITSVKVETSVRQKRISFTAHLQDLGANGPYWLLARITQDGRPVARFRSKAFDQTHLEEGRITYSSEWLPEGLWDIHSPANLYSLSVSLLGKSDQVLDTAFDVRFGFRELWIDGRDFILNGSRVFLCAVPLDNAQIGAALAGYAGARETLERLKSMGINLVYTHNYGCEPGTHLGFAEILRAADDVGMLVSFSQPHFSHYDWKAPDADRSNGYQRHAAFYARQAENHPSVVFYAMSHNGTGYFGDMDPDLIDGIHDPREPAARRNPALALRAEAIVRRLDPGRIVYHHASGNLGSIHSINFYPNMVPIQELSDWFGHWATTGVKPAFMCEYGAPFTWDWSMYRGWYKGERTFGSARVPWELCFAEWNAQFLGDRAFPSGALENTNLRWESKQFRAGNLWHRWDYPYELGSPRFAERHTVIGRYITDNWRAFRTWGVSGISPWEHGHYWTLRDGVDRGRRELPVDWNHLQRPGFSADFVDGRYERHDIAFERSDWIPTEDGEALLRNNRPLLAYIGGPNSHFTSKEHIFLPGETVEKQLIIVNNSRVTVGGDCSWSLGTFGATEPFTVGTGQQVRIPVSFTLPDALAPGSYNLSATFKFSTGDVQEDSLSIRVLPRPPAAGVGTGAAARIAIFDPKGETSALLAAMNTPCQPVDAGADLSAYDVLIVGKSALTVDGPAPRIEQVRAGLKVIVFEQTAPVLEQRLGFRVTEYGLRQVFPRLLDHQILAGLGVDELRDWRGDATIVPPRLEYPLRTRQGPSVKWCDIPVTRLWRCGNRGNVASVLIEKPARGNFLPIVDGGFSLQYSPLLEYREGLGLVLFCQLDVTGRTETEPAAGRLVRNIVQYVATWTPAIPRGRKVVYAGEPAGLSHLASAGIAASAWAGQNLTPEHVLVVGPGGAEQLAASAPALAGWLKAGGNLLAIGLDEAQTRGFLPFAVEMKRAEYISTGFEPFAAGSPFAGVGPADVHNRDPRELSLVTAGAARVGNGVLARVEGMNVVFCQLVPWQFEYTKQYNLKRTYRRASCLVARLLANMGVGGATPTLARFSTPVPAAAREERWLTGLYLDRPEEWDDPYRFFRW